MSKYSLNVHIDPRQVTMLKNYGYKLCISKKVDGKYTVVWDGSSFIVDNKFEWEEEYRIYALDKPPTGALTEAGTGAVHIALGQKVTISKEGVMSSATGPMDGTNFHVINNYKPVYIVLEQKFGGQFRPVWIDPFPTLVGSETITPIPAVMLFFHKKIETSSIIAEVDTSSIEVKFHSTTKMGASYTPDPKQAENGLWGITDGSLSKTSLPTSYSQEHGFTPLPSAFDVGALAELYTLSKAGFIEEEPKAIEAAA